jgi:hypothetical protein
MTELEGNLEENYEGSISCISFFLVQHHPCEPVTWWFSLVKQFEHSELHTGFSIHRGVGIYLLSFIMSSEQDKTE